MSYMKILHIYICLVMVSYWDSFLKYLARLVQNLKKKILCSNSVTYSSKFKEYFGEWCKILSV